ncbi:MAG: molybdopterin synthase sulfur carrier subunit [Candidatus Lindowbacteria bacterium RIFCSPLOWO2_12_FULL_62_27]|nr:MAG: molybdopterin synthase sulfur carrier subunit [Candidatus Lindowbacteria bacterium RIFCSPLOWO2_02_FULL_62_12]OGH62439.1 MAG: molybdopterin synthase sulfur carrier subunit [Candidatus Lindowbacteria bacterium RIFCSPLOWO2_12_FULL_62_27]
MPVTILIPTVLRQYTGNQATVAVDGKTVGDTLQNLAAAHPGLKTHIFTDNGKLRSFVNVFVNEDDIRQKGDMNAPVKNGDEVSIVPSIAGGRR